MRSTHYCILQLYSCLVNAGPEAVNILSKRIREVNIQAQLRVDEETWPPEPPKTFTPLALIQHQGQRNFKHTSAIATFVAQGYIDKVVSNGSGPVSEYYHTHTSHQPLQEVLDTSKVTKEVAEILAPLETNDDPQFVLIEGAPGMGKSTLLREVAYRWATKLILQHKLVLLICLRNPAVQQMSLIDDLLQLFCKRDRRAGQIASTCSDYLSENNGKDLVLLLDGYDEYPEILRKESLIADILKRKELPNCSLIMTSRPHATIKLRQQATAWACILGFTENEREHYIKESINGQSQKIEELMKYLQSHPTISNLCFIPFNMVVLVYLYKQGMPFPKNSAELFNYFICITIYRHLAKSGNHISSSITQFAELPRLTDLPESCSRIIHQLSKLSLEALSDNKLIFTLNEIKSACPDIAATPEAINGLGLLQSIQHYGLIGTTMTFNFLHFSIQEYLAAQYITTLSADEELKIIKEKFWSDTHLNMFSTYVTLTKGQRPAFKQFLCNGNKTITISDEFLSNQLQCFRLYHCFHEAGDVDICKTIEQSVTFRNKAIELSDTRVTPGDMECVTVFFASVHCKKWMRLNLSYCCIQDHGLHILCRGLLHCSNVIINKLWLSHNGLTTQSCPFISDITIQCKVKALWIEGNRITEKNKQLYSMLTNPSTKLKQLFMSNTKLSTEGVAHLFEALMNNYKLQELYINHNAITDDACDAITAALAKNSCLVTLFMYNNPLTGDGMVNLVSGLKKNNTLEWLRLPRCCCQMTIRRIVSQQRDINNGRISKGYQGMLRIYYH